MDKKPPLIAIVDDEETIRRALERLLRSAALEVETFSSGIDFLAALATHPIACVVLDIHMSGVNGFDVQARMMQLGSVVPIIVMTGHDMPDSRARAMAGGAVAYLLKPVDERVLLDTIATAIS